MMISLLCSSLANTKAQNYILIKASFNSEALGEAKKVNIFLPPDYYENPDLEYATIYYLHGGYGDQNSGDDAAFWYYHTTTTSNPAIFVCPDGSCEPYQGSCWMNSTLYGAYEDYFIQDVIGFVENNFRADPKFRALTGRSMGGYGSARFCVNYPEMFRACIPQSGFPAIPDTLLNTWKELYYNENGSYIPTINNGEINQLLLTMCGGLSPNMTNPPTYVDFPFDTLGNLVDTVLERWYQNDLSRKVKDLPDEHELSWFMICGTEDYMVTYPCYQMFTDSLSFYGIEYESNYFEGGHGFDPESWKMAVLWLDGIVSGIEIKDQSLNYIFIYPNPASGEISINYELKNPATVHFTLTDLQGKQHRVLTKELNTIGKQTEILDLSDLPQGAYFIRMQVGNESITKKIIKLK